MACLILANYWEVCKTPGFSKFKFFPGGIESMAITEVFGGMQFIWYQYFTNFTSCRVSNWKNSIVTHTLWYVVLPSSDLICTSLALTVTTQLPGANGYTGGKVVFVDTEVQQ